MKCKPETRRVLDALPCTRKAGAKRLFVTDRQFRRLVQLAREDGFPILSPDGDSEMYRLAKTDAEIERCYDALHNRSMALMRTAYLMKKRYHADGQEQVQG